MDEEYDDSKFAIKEYVGYEDDYLEESFYHKMYMVLSNLKEDSNIDNAYSKSGLAFDLKITEMLLDNNFIKGLNLNNFKKDVLRKNPDVLSQLLKEKGINASGKKKKLIKLVLENVDPIKVCSTFSVTDEGDEFLNEFSWFEIYDEYLEPFSFMDILKYINEHDGEFNELIIDYIDEHIDLAHKKRDFDYLDVCLISKSRIYLYQKNYRNCIESALKEVILKLNPIYEYEILYAIYIIFIKTIIDNINKCLEEIDIDIESLFNELWDLKDSNKDFCSKKEGFSYFKRALDGEDLTELSDEYEKKYIQVIYRE